MNPIDIERAIAVELNLAESDWHPVPLGWR